MQESGTLVPLLGDLFGTGKGRGIAVMISCIGIALAIIVFVFYTRKPLRNIDTELDDIDVELPQPTNDDLAKNKPCNANVIQTNPLTAQPAQALEL